MTRVLTAITTALVITASIFFQQQVFADESSNVKYTQCGAESDILTFNDVYFEPEFIQAGDQVTIDATGSLSQDITQGAKVQADLTYFGKPYYTHTYDYCDFVNNRDNIDYDIKCPMSQGHFEVSQVVTIPNDVPKGVYTLRLTATTESGESVGCIEVEANFQ